jgi:two-component system sensor histidine kinase KdpD
VIEAASAMMKVPGSTGTALYVGDSSMESKNAVLRENIAFACSCGFQYSSINSTDIAFSIAEYARRIKATNLFIGSSPPAFFIQTKKTLSEQLTVSLNDVTIHIIPNDLSSIVPYMQKETSLLPFQLADCMRVILLMSAATVVSWWFYQSRYSNANIITVYILAVLISSLITTRRRYGILAAVLYILLFNFLFIEPRFTLLVYDSAYMMTYFVSLAAALITSSLAAHAQAIARRSAENAYQAKVLLDTSNQLERASDPAEMTAITCQQLVRLLNRTVLFYPAGPSAKEPQIFPADRRTAADRDLKLETEAVQWTKENSRRCGAFTDRFSRCRCQYIAIHADNRNYGVIGIDMNQRPFSGFEQNILYSIVYEAAMALDNERMRQEHHRAEIAAENERMRAALLRSISHDLRTPLTSIYGNAVNLAENAAAMSDSDRQEIYGDLQENSAWLIRQMENILSMTRIENKADIKMSVENIEDVILESIRHLGQRTDHVIETQFDEEPLFALMNPQLIMLVMDNLLNNALKYTPSGTKITVSAFKENGLIRISVADEGSGVPDEDKPHIFDLFYTGKKMPSDSCRNMGIGLNLCQLIMKVHDSSIEVGDAAPHGAVFTFFLQAKEVNL